MLTLPVGGEDSMAKQDKKKNKQERNEEKAPGYGDKNLKDLTDHPHKYTYKG